MYVSIVVFRYSIYIHVYNQCKRNIRYNTTTPTFKIKCIMYQNIFGFFCVVLCVSFCTGQFVMVPLNLTYLHCLQRSLFEHLFNLYWNLCFVLVALLIHFLYDIKYVQRRKEDYCFWARQGCLCVLVGDTNHDLIIITLLCSRSADYIC